MDISDIPEIIYRKKVVHRLVSLPDPTIIFIRKRDIYS